MNRSTSTTGDSHVTMRNLPVHLVRALAPPRIRAGVLVALALLSAACSDSASRMLSSPLSSSSSKSPSAAASNFAVLANTAVTCTNGTIIGDVGTNQSAGDAPPGSVTRTLCPVTGSVHVGDGVAKQAYKNFLAEYAALAPAPGFCNSTNTLIGTLAGVVLSPGTYCVDAVAKTGTLTLNGNGAFTFLVLGALTGTNFSVVLTGGAEACDVTWRTDAAATMTDSRFVGTILAGAGITLTRGTFDGNVYSKADVTITGTAVTGCEGRKGQGKDKDKDKCNQGVGNGPEGCDPGNSNHRNPSNDENGGTPGNPGRKP